MRVTALAVTAFRNLADQRIEPASALNVFFGDNGQGKTNLLEALFVLATLRSFRAPKLVPLVAWSQTRARLTAEVERAGLEHRLEVTIENGRRQAEVDGKPTRSAAAWARELAVVLFTPEDLALLRASPAARRRFLDRAVFELQPDYLALHKAYERALRARNALLEGGSPPADLLSVYDSELGRHGSLLQAARARYLGQLSPFFERLVERILGETGEPTPRSRVALTYHPSPPGGDYPAALAASRRADLARCTSGVGAHRDDFHVTLDGHPAAEHASQGQTRSLVLALKIGEILLLHARRDEEPILLLDDVASELDPGRARALFRLVEESGAQTFVTATRPSLLPGLSPDGCYRLAAGRAERVDRESG